MDNYGLARINMVKNQILPGNVSQEAMVTVLFETPRHLFVPERLSAIAYTDENIELAEGRYFLPPLLFAKMLQLAKINKDTKILDVGCGYGYSSAVFSKIAKKVVATECDSALASKANLALNRLGYDNVIVIGGKLPAGHPEGAPYDVIFINGAIEEIPQPLVEQLAGNGSIIAIMKDSDYTGNVIVAKKIGDKMGTEYLFDAVFSVLPGFEKG